MIALSALPNSCRRASRKNPGPFFRRFSGAVLAAFLLVSLQIGCGGDSTDPLSTDDSDSDGTPPEDTTPPDVSLSASETMVLQEMQLVLTAAATDEGGVTTVTFVEEDVTLGIVTQPPYELRIDLAAANNGIHYYKAKAMDAAGNEATSGRKKVVVYVDAQVGFQNGGFTTNSDGWDLHDFDEWSGWTADAGDPPGCMRLNEFGSCAVDPGITQVVQGLMPGVTFRIIGEYRPFAAPYGNPFAESFVITVDGDAVASFARGPAGEGWSPFEVDFTATATAHTIGFWAEYDCDDSSYELDNVELTIAP